MFSLTHFMTILSFYTSCKHHKTSGFLMFSGGTKETKGMKWVKVMNIVQIQIILDHKKYFP